MKLLVVDDERRIAESIKQGLEQEGYAVDVAFDGEDGYNAAWADEYDAIILDVMMPVMNGFEVVQKLRSRGNHTPVLMLTAKDQTQFVSDASHELRTPLTALRTANEVALRNPKLTLAEARAVIEANVTDATRLQTLANTMLGLLRHDRSAVQLQPVALQTVVSEAMNLVVAPAQAKSIAIDDTTPPLMVRAHQQRLVQLLTILLDNAIKYSPEHTTITITAESTNRWARVQIIDQGIGMDAATQRQIFQRFYRADQARTGGLGQGYGLGLAIAQQIITEHGGKITVDSTPGSGTTFTVGLRLAGR